MSLSCTLSGSEIKRSIVEYKRVHSTVVSSHEIENSLDILESEIIGSHGCKFERYLATISAGLKPER